MDSTQLVDTRAAGAARQGDVPRRRRRPRRRLPFRDGPRCGVAARLRARELLAAVPPAAVESFAGVGHFFDMAQLRPGETAVDLGSGSGTDLFLAALQVGERGRVTGIDMTDAQLTKATRLAREHGFTNVELVQGRLEETPLVDSSADVVISNGVINLCPDKPRAFAEAARLLRPGGRLAIADIVSGRELAERTRRNIDLWAACVAGAIPQDEYLAGLEAAGLEYRSRPREPCLPVHVGAGARGLRQVRGDQRFDSRAQTGLGQRGCHDPPDLLDRVEVAVQQVLEHDPLDARTLQLAQPLDVLVERPGHGAVARWARKSSGAASDPCHSASRPARSSSSAWSAPASQPVISDSGIGSRPASAHAAVELLADRPALLGGLVDGVVLVRVARGHADAARPAAPADDQVRARRAARASAARGCPRPTAGPRAGADPRACASARRVAGRGSRRPRARPRASPCRYRAPRARRRRGRPWRPPWRARRDGGRWRATPACRSRSFVVTAASALIVAQASSDPRSPRPNTDR